MKRVFLYLFILAGLIIPCHLSASEIALTENIPTDSLIDSIALSPGTDTAFGIDKEKKCLYIIDVNNHIVTKKVPLGRRPVGIAVNPSNNIACVTLKNNGFFNKKGSVCTVDSSGAVLHTYTIHGTPHGIAINPENNTVVIALEKEKKLLVLSAETMQTLQEIRLPFKPRLVALDEDSNRAVVTAGKGDFSWWQHIIMVVDLNTGAVINTIKFRRGIKGIAVDTDKDIAVTTGLKEINLFDINTGSILSTARECDNLLSRLKLKGCSDNNKPDDKDFEDDDDIDRDINRFLDRYHPEIDEAIVKDLKGAGSGLSAFQADHTYGLDINQSTHIAVISGEESLLLLDMNTNTLNEFPLDDVRHLRAVAVDRYRNISLVSYLKHKQHKRHDTGILEVQLPNPVPEITGLTPSFATSGDPDTALRISGNSFITSSSVQFSLYSLNTFFADNNTLDALVPSALLSKACIYPVTVTNPVPSGGISNSIAFTVLNPAPSISVIDPSEAMAGTQRLDINLFGTGFTDDSTVFINGIARNYTPVSRTKLMIRLTSADLETGGYLETRISNPPPGGGMSNSFVFTVLNPAPQLASISPSSVTAGNPAFTLSLTGSNFISTTAVYFNNTPVPVTFISNTRINIAISPEAITNPGTYPVKVSNTAPGGGESGTVNLTVNAPSVPDLGANHDEQEGGEGLIGGNIRILNGNVIESRNDVQFPSPNKTGLSFDAFYNSRAAVSGVLGYGWTHSFEATLAFGCLFEGEVLLRITDNTGAARFFKESSPGQYQGYFDERTKIINESGEYVWYRQDGIQYGFSSQGKLIWIADEKANRLVISYGANELISTVADTACGRTLAFNYNSNDLLENITGPVTSAVSDGKWVQYGYDVTGNLISVTYADGSGFIYGYTDPEDIHNLTEKRNKANHLLNTWIYDSEDRAIKSFSLDGTGVTVGYAGGTQVTVTDAYGTTRTYNVVGEGSNKRISAMSGASGAPYSGNNAVRWEYAANMNLVEVEYAGGAINLYQNHDERGNPGTFILASGAPEQRKINYTYHPNMNVPLTRAEASVSGSGNKVTTWDYDDDYDSTPNENPGGALCRVIEQGFTVNDTGAVVPYEYVTELTYNSKGRILSVDSPLSGAGDTTVYDYDPATGDLTSITSPHTGSTLFQIYDNAGQPGRIMDVNNHATDYTYDARGRVTNTYHASDSSNSSAPYNTAGFIESRQDEDGVNTGYAYDTTYGRLQRIIDHENNYIEHLYDANGNVTDKSYYTAGGVRTSWKRFNYQHPVMPGKLFREIKHDDTFMEYAYDLKGNLSGVRDFNGNVTAYEYDVLNRLNKVTQPGNVTTLYAYDLHGNLQSVMDANLNTTVYKYDDMGRLIETASPDTGVVKYAYDEAGNLKRKVDAKGIVVQYAYDNLNRLTNVQYPDSSQDITYTYDQGTNSMGFRSGMTDQSGTISFGYDARGRLTDKISTISGHTYPISRAYTPGGRVNLVAYPTGRTIDYQRGGCACNVSSISTSFAGNVVTLMNNLIYRPFGGVSGMDNGAGGIIGSQSDLSGRLSVSNPGAVHEKTYGYDNNDNLTSISAPSTPWQSRTYGYDALNRLTHAEGPYGTIDYTYDNVGNRQTRSEGGSVTSYTYYPDTNRLHEAVTGAEIVNHTFDPNGNITDIGNKTLTYNHDNRLVRVEENIIILGEYIYNGLGQRVVKTAGGTTTVFLYDFDGNIIGESDQTGSISKEYLYKGSSRLAMVDVLTGKMYYYGNDKLGTPQIMTDATNTVVWEADYKPFGEAEVNSNSSIVNNFRFPGQYYDAETKLHYNYHRYYDPVTGRYLTADPIGLAGGDDNLYGYVLNDPVNYADPLGLFGAGGADAPYPGHNDFSGSNKFNYYLEDLDPETSPYTDPERHFRDLSGSQSDVSEAIASCDENAFQRAMHRGQDFFSHYNKGYRWAPFRSWQNLGFGHFFDGTIPDQDKNAWQQANQWTNTWLQQWNNNCGCE